MDETGKIEAKHLRLLRVAYEYQKWMTDNGFGMSFPSFCNDFGYVNSGDPFMSVMFDNVVATIRFAQENC